MLRRGGGHIVNVSSIAGIGVYPGLTAYSASKAALSHFTAGLRADLPRSAPISTTLVERAQCHGNARRGTQDYEPTDKSFERFYRSRMSAEVPEGR